MVYYCCAGFNKVQAEQRIAVSGYAYGVPGVRRDDSVNESIVEKVPRAADGTAERGKPAAD